MKVKCTLLTALTSCLLMFVGVHCNKPGGDDPVQPNPPPAVKPGAVKGSITNEFNQLLPGASINIRGNRKDTSFTATNGHYILGSLAPGLYNLSVNKEGYIESSVALSITTGDTLTKDVSLKAGTAYLTLLSDSVIIAKPFAGSFTLKVGSNTTWNINNATDWIIPGKQGGSGDDSIVIQIAASQADEVREGSFWVQAGVLQKKVTVKQMPEVKLNSVTPLPGNHALGINDSISLEFNQPVTIHGLIPGYSLCHSEMRFSYSGNKVTFSYGCAALGGEYPFTITTKNSIGDQYTFTFTDNFYVGNISLNGSIKSHFVNDADNSYWIITNNPNALYKIDMTSFKVLHQYNLPEEPVMFTVSPYNNKIYLAYRHNPKLYILNQDGTTDQVITIKADPSRTEYERDGPRIHPVKLTFARNGLGLIWLSDRDPYSYTGYWFIDAAANHRIWYQALPGAAVNYQDAVVNYDKTKIVLTYMNNDPTVGIFDAQQMTFSNFRPARVDIKGFVTPSRKNGNIYIGQLYFQSVFNTANGVETAAINRDNRNAGNVDFYNRAGKDQTVYFTEGGNMEVIDYAMRKTMVKYDAIHFLQGTTATLDGKYVIVHRNDGNYNARVIQFPAEWFNF